MYKTDELTVVRLNLHTRGTPSNCRNTSRWERIPTGSARVSLCHAYVFIYLVRTRYYVVRKSYYGRNY